MHWNFKLSQITLTFVHSPSIPTHSSTCGLSLQAMSKMRVFVPVCAVGTFPFGSKLQHIMARRLHRFYQTHLKALVLSLGRTMNGWMLTCACICTWFSTW